MTVADPQRRGSPPRGSSFDQQRPSMTVCPFQKPVNKLLSLGLLVGLVFGSADQVRGQIVPLPTFNIETDQTSISGVSSGGYMAVQFAPRPTDWQFIHFDDADTAGGLGYHDLTHKGQPISKISV